MSSTIRPIRSSLRRKMVLPVTVVRRNGEEKQLAHTLDLTGASARLGGLRSLLEPGEIVEIHRGAVKAKFQVFWMGAAGSAMEGQAGVRILEADKNIWSVDLPPDEPDHCADALLRGKNPLQTHAPGRAFTEKRWHTRFECAGGASVRALDSTFPVHGQVKDIAQGGVYVETTTPVPVNTEVYVRMNVEGVAMETPGVVRTSYPMVGMGISFQNVSSENQEKIDHLIHTIRNRVAAPKNITEPAFEPVSPSKTRPGTQVETCPVRMLAAACRTLAENFDNWKMDQSKDELEELQLALSELQDKLSRAPGMELESVLYSAFPQTNIARFNEVRRIHQGRP